MQAPRIVVLSCALFLLAACSTAPVSTTDATAAKLRQATDLFENRGNAIDAERLIREAMRTYEAEGDRVGLADAYRTYGFFLRSHAVALSQAKYRRDGFLDPTIIFDRRHEKALEYHLKARDLYAEKKRHDRLADIYLAIAADNAIIGRRQAACAALEQSLESERAAVAENARFRFDLPQGFKTFDAYVLSLKKDDRCI